MVTHIWDIYGIYPKKHMFAKKLKIEQKLNEIKMRKNSLQEEFPNFESILAIFVVVERGFILQWGWKLKVLKRQLVLTGR
jgi:hypothetical protein